MLKMEAMCSSETSFIAETDGLYVFSLLQKKVPGIFLGVRAAGA
jgi:hypothetical protein